MIDRCVSSRFNEITFNNKRRSCHLFTRDRTDKANRLVVKPSSFANHRLWLVLATLISLRATQRVGRKMFSLLIVICVAFASEVIARPSGDSFVFRDDEDVSDDNQILPSIDDLKSIGESDEVVKYELENGKLFQGDIKLVQDQKDYYLAKPNGSVPTRTGWIDEYYRWPKDKEGHVIVPFYLSPQSKFSKMRANKFHDILRTCSVLQASIKRLCYALR